MGTRRQEPRSQRPTREQREGSGAAGAGAAAPASRGAGAGKPPSRPWSRERERERQGEREEIAAGTRTGVCPVCGTEFDPSSDQALVSALGRAPFDLVECADIALADRRRAESELAQKRRRRRSRA